MVSPLNIVIVGNGIAGVTAARIIKEKDPQTKVTIYTDEIFHYYPRPKLYDILSGKSKPQDITIFSNKWYQNKGIKVNLNNKIIRINPKKNEITLKNKSKTKYDKLILANGGHPFVPPIKNFKKQGIFTLHSMSDAIRIRKYAEKTRKAIIIGGGLLGLEFASSLKKLGQKVTVVELSSRLLPKQLDIDGANFLRKHFTSQGIEIILKSKTNEFLGDKKVTGILLESEEIIEADFAIICAGIKPNTEITTNTEINTNRGIIVDQFLRTNIDDIYAIGDAVEFKNKVYGIIPAAVDQAKIVGSNILKKESEIYKGTIPTNSLKIVDIEMTSIGLVNPDNSSFNQIKEMDHKKRFYKKIVLDQGRIVGAILLGNRKGESTIKKLISEETDISKYMDLILKEGFEFKKILPN